MLFALLALTALVSHTSALSSAGLKKVRDAGKDDCQVGIPYWGDGLKQNACPCVDEPHMPALKESLHQRLEHVAMSPEGRWKMPSTWNRMLNESSAQATLADCGSCEDQKDKTMTKPKLDFKKIFYINLPASTHRRGFIEDQLTRQGKSGGIPIELFVGTDPVQAKAFNLKRFSEKGLQRYVQDLPERPKWGTVGTYISHLDLLQHILDIDPQGEGLYVIVEDDITLDHDWKEKVQNAFWQNGIPEDWDILKFGYWGRTRCQDAVTDHAFEARTPPMTKSGKHLYNGNLGYIVRPKSIPAILEQAKSLEIFDVDGVLMSLHTEKKSAGEDGKTYYNSWGVHTYYLKESLVRGGTGGQGLATERMGGENAHYNKI